ncbi:MAG: hypothetical protein ACYTFT_12280 [Planctomycetota bacterium]|jgi:hypothetical protein
MRRWILAAAVGAFVFACASAPVQAKNDLPTPAEALKQAVKALAKAKSFDMLVEARGGLAKDAKQLTCSSALVTREFSTGVVRPLMKVSEPESYLVLGRTKGATLFEGNWRSVMAGPKAREIPKLVKAPELVLATALKYAKKDGFWLAEGAQVETWSKPGEDDTDGRTVARGGAEDEEGTRMRPTRLRVIGPASQAIKITTEVQNSGCLDGG